MVAVDSRHQYWSRSCGGGFDNGMLGFDAGTYIRPRACHDVKWELANFRASGPILRIGNGGHPPSTTNGCEIDTTTNCDVT